MIFVIIYLFYDSFFVYEIVSFDFCFFALFFCI